MMNLNATGQLKSFMTDLAVFVNVGSSTLY